MNSANGRNRRREKLEAALNAREPDTETIAVLRELTQGAPAQSPGAQAT